MSEEKTRGNWVTRPRSARRKDPDAGDRIAAREQPEVGEVGKIRYTLRPSCNAPVPSFLLTSQHVLCVLNFIGAPLESLNFPILNSVAKYIPVRFP